MPVGTKKATEAMGFQDLPNNALSVPQLSQVWGREIPRFIRKNTCESHIRATWGVRMICVFTCFVALWAVLCVVLLSRVFISIRVFTRFLASRCTRDVLGTQQHFIGVPRGLPRGPEELKMSPRRAPKGGPRDPKGPPGDPQRAHKARDGQHVTKDRHNIHSWGFLCSPARKSM